MNIPPNFRGEPPGHLKDQEFRDLAVFFLVHIDVYTITNVISKCCKHMNEFDGVVPTSACSIAINVRVFFIGANECICSSTPCFLQQDEPN
jgi:hypothetical protein